MFIGIEVFVVADIEIAATAIASRSKNERMISL